MTRVRSANLLGDLSADACKRPAWTSRASLPFRQAVSGPRIGVRKLSLFEPHRHLFTHGVQFQCVTPCPSDRCIRYHKGTSVDSSVRNEPCSHVGAPRGIESSGCGRPRSLGPKGQAGRGGICPVPRGRPAARSRRKRERRGRLCAFLPALFGGTVPNSAKNRALRLLIPKEKGLAGVSPPPPPQRPVAFPFGPAAGSVAEISPR